MNHIASPDNSDRGIEALIQAKGKTAARVTPDDIKANIVGEYYFTAQDGVTVAQPLQYVPNDHDTTLGLLTFCVLVLKNGFMVTGESACASPENFDADIGRRVARESAVQKIWPLMGYELKERLHRKAVATAKGSSPLRGAPNVDPTIYTCHKQVKAVPMNRQAYNDLRCWQLPDNENGLDEGYLVEYLDGGQANVPGYVGYISWSPKVVFEAGYTQEVAQ